LTLLIKASATEIFSIFLAPCAHPALMVVKFGLEESTFTHIGATGRFSSAEKPQNQPPK